jgi:outer membrane protein OmpA-like peptidoglycan-associated protein
MVFENIEFDPMESDIKPEMQPILDEVAYFMIDHPTYLLEISGHTDSAGNPDFNQELSQDRANAIRQYIEQKVNLDEGRVIAIGYGSSKPLREEKTEEDKRINRRVEFRVEKPDRPKK